MKYFCTQDMQLEIDNETTSVCMISETSWLFLKKNGTLYYMGDDNINKDNILACSNITGILSNYEGNYRNNKDIKVWLIYSDNQYDEWVCDIDRYIYKENKDLKREFNRNDGTPSVILKYLEICINDNEKILKNILIKPNKKVSRLFVDTGLFVGVYSEGGIFSNSEDIHGKRATDFVYKEISSNHSFIFYLLTREGRIRVFEVHRWADKDIYDNVHFDNIKRKEKELKELPRIVKLLSDNNRVFFMDENDNLYTEFGVFISDNVLKVSSSNSGYIIIKKDGSVLLKHNKGEYILKDRKYNEVYCDMNILSYYDNLTGYLTDETGTKYKFTYSPEFTYNSTYHSISMNNSYEETINRTKKFTISPYYGIIAEQNDSNKICIGEILQKKIYATFESTNILKLSGGVYDIPYITKAVKAYKWGNRIGIIADIITQ